MEIPLKLLLCETNPQISHSTSSSKTTTVITLSLTFVTSTTFLTQLLLQHISYTTNSISFSRPPQPISPSFHPQHTSTSSIILFLSSSQTSPPFPLRLPKFHIPTRTPMCLSGLPSYCKLCLYAPG